MQFFTRFVRSRRGNLAAQAAFALGAAATLAESRPAMAQVPETGVWINDQGKGAIEIKPCGAALCGNIVWLKEPLNEQGQPLFDRRNPDESKRNRPICGLPVIGNVKRTSEGWDEGWIYSPEEGAQYDVAIKASGNNLIVTGYKGIKLFSKTLTWTRAPADLQRCEGAPGSQTKAKPAIAPPKLAAPNPQGGAPAAAKKPVSATAVPSSAKPVSAGEPNKAPVKDAKAVPAAGKQPASAASAKKATPAAAGASKTAAIDKSGKAAPGAAKPNPAAKAAAKQPAAQPAKKTAATSAVPGATTKPAVAKKPATTTASTATDKKLVAPAPKPAAKPAVKKKPADEDDAPSAVE